MKPLVSSAHIKDALKLHKERIYFIIFWVIIASALGAIIWFSVNFEYVPTNDEESIHDFHDLTATVRQVSPILIPIKNAFSNYTVPIEVIIFHKPSSDFTISQIKLSNTANSILTFNGVFKNVTKPLNLTKLLNLTKPLTRPTPIIETYDMLVTVRHNLEVTNTTKPYTIDIFSVNKTIIPPSNATTILTNAVNKSTTTLTNALNNKTNVILNAAKSLLNKRTTTKLPVDSG